ncbi:hypothetical protein EVC45_30660 [Paraburkholderia sp. UYCP14C]|uniref:hypothetical protein n=1 Tax=Paraburkholderia sp. UYCP14C TaxID=2511130 RepID=UPI0010205DF5|nr:hypothetical protein [Paraburkholderia sp. UYCP14C]RZF25917.1 hypothetical protein EVC45_30660 [Paraburkholderia sp. UYCP14C]
MASLRLHFLWVAGTAIAFVLSLCINQEVFARWQRSYGLSIAVVVARSATRMLADTLAAFGALAVT